MLSIEVKAADIFQHKKMSEAWFRAETDYQDHPSKVTGYHSNKESNKEEGSTSKIENCKVIWAAKQHQQLGGQCPARYAHLRNQCKRKLRRGRKQLPHEIVRGVGDTGIKQK